MYIHKHVITHAHTHPPTYFNLKRLDAKINSIKLYQTESDIVVADIFESNNDYLSKILKRRAKKTKTIATQMG